MNKKWLPIGLCVAFILIWEIFVIRPETQKQLALQQKAQEAAKAHSNTTAQNPSAVTSPQAPIVLPTLTEEQKAQATVVALSSKRDVKIFQNGAIGAAVFNDYRVRGDKNDHSVSLVNDGFAWTSTDAQIQDCITKFQKTSASGGASFQATTEAGNCRLTYQSNPSHPGLLNVKLSLSGFSASNGNVEFRAADILGNARIEERHYLNFKVEGSSETVRDDNLLKPELEKATRKGTVDWLAWGDKYFAAILIPKKENGAFNPNIVYGALAPHPEKASFGFQYPFVSKAGSESNYEFEIYFGTRDSDELALISPGLTEVVDLGFFGAVARLMLWSLKYINKFVGNFGVAIIILTVLVRIAFWPLNRKVFDSGLKMKALQPEIERLKAKYGNDKAKAAQMNQELIGLYRQYKVNPMGSCLPLLLQMPIFLGLYGALNHSLDLYQAPFFVWIKDLSSPDPFYVFPVLWTLTLIAYTKLTPTPQAPSSGGQAAPDMTKIMFVMNIVFGFLSKDWPAGLTLYLFVSNLVGITQQLMFKRAAKLQPIQEGA